jgi:hypothetical protein
MDIDAHSAFIEAHLRSLREAASAFTDSYFGYVEWFTPETEPDRQRLAELGRTIKSLLEGARGGRKGISGYRDSVAGLRRRNISQDLNRASERLVPALDGILKIMGQIETFCSRLLRLINRKLSV